jgi:hypothetical protein
MNPYTTHTLMTAISQPDIITDIGGMLRRLGFSDTACTAYVSKLHDLGTVADLDGLLTKALDADPAGRGGENIKRVASGHQRAPPTS